MRLFRWVAIGVGVALVVLTIVAGAGSRTPTLRRLVVETLGDRLDSEIELAAFSVDTFPTVDVRGEGLVVRLAGRRDIPPLITIRRFIIKGGVLGLLQRPRRFRSVTLEGLEINIPPGGADFSGRYGNAANPESADQPSSSPIHIDSLSATDAVLRIIPRKAGKTPREFVIHQLAMSGVGVEERMPFQAELTNPIPRGQIRTEGRFGPWAKDDPGTTPLEGKYFFDKADLGTIKGIGGILTSTGQFKGQLARIEVEGETRTPDFHLDLARKPMPLTTTFQAIVDGTDGDTYLNAVNAQLGRTTFLANGAVVGTPGVKGRTVQLHVKVEEGRIEDVLRLVMKPEKPVLTGRLALHTDFTLPPGEPDVVERLKLSGEFDLSGAQFSDPGVRNKLAGMSSRARGRDAEEAPESVLTDLEGRFRLERGTMSFPNLRFGIPGATVQLAGSYGLQSESIDFEGTLLMSATISEAAGGGIKSVLLKVVDPLFRGKKAGAVIPLRIRGTREDPKFGLDVGRVFKPKS